MAAGAIRTSADAPLAPLRNPPNRRRLRGLLVLDRLQLVAGPNGDPTRLLLLGHLAHEFDGQQAVLQPRLADLDVIGEVEAPLEGVRRNAPIEVLGVLRLRFLTGDDQHIRLGYQGDLVRLPAGQRQRHPIHVLAGFFDVVGWSYRFDRLSPPGRADRSSDRSRYRSATEAQSRIPCS